MSDITKKHRITINYHCTETEQEATITVDYTRGKDSYKMELTTEFEPSVKEDTQDPMGFLGRLLESLKQ